MKGNWWLLAICGVPLAAAGETFELLPSPLQMPRRIGPLVYEGVPHSFVDPGLGVGYQYGGNGLSLTVYVYDLGASDIPDGADSVASCEQFEEAKAGVFQARYPKTALKSEQLVRLSPPDERPLAREAVFEFSVNRRATYSYVWITGAAKNFVKLRFTVDAALRDELPEARRAILSAFGDAVKPHLQVAAPTQPGTETKQPGPSIVLNSLGDSQDDTNAGMVYLLLLSTLAEKSPESQAPCGGQVIPTFDVELSAYRSMAGADSLVRDSPFGRQLAAINNAGFLEEFVWSDRHRERWGNKSPEGLALSKYKKWRKKNLKDFHVADAGSVVFDRPRVLPVEAPDAP